MIVELTPREREVLAHVVAGVKRSFAYRSLQISCHTLDTYIDRFNTISGAHNRYELTAWALLTGQVQPAEIYTLWETYNPALAAWRVNDTATI